MGLLSSIWGGLTVGFAFVLGAAVGTEFEMANFAVQKKACASWRTLWIAWQSFSFNTLAKAEQDPYLRPTKKVSRKNFYCKVLEADIWRY